MMPQIFPHLAGKVSDYEGQLVLQVKYPGNAKGAIGKHAFEAEVRELLKQYGSICAFETMPVPGDEQMCMLAEFHDVDRVARAVARLDGITIEVRNPLWPVIDHVLTQTREKS